MTFISVWRRINLTVIDEPKKSQRYGRLIRGWGGAAAAVAALFLVMNTVKDPALAVPAQAAALIVSARALTVGIFPLHWSRVLVQLLVSAGAAFLAFRLDLPGAAAAITVGSGLLTAAGDSIELWLRRRETEACPTCSSPRPCCLSGAQGQAMLLGARAHSA